jgi:hypothetical protein
MAAGTGAGHPHTRFNRRDVGEPYLGFSVEFSWFNLSARGAAMLKVGDKVRKRSGYEFPGIVVSVFTTRAGVVRVVVEADHPAFKGMLHIFGPEQLELRSS